MTNAEMITAPMPSTPSTPTVGNTISAMMRAIPRISSRKPSRAVDSFMAGNASPGQTPTFRRH